MKTRLTLLILLILHLSSFAQLVTKKELSQYWVVKKGWFGDETISLEILNKEKQKDLVELLIFNTDGVLKEELYNPQHWGMCGNGMLYFESATWRLDTNAIVFDVKGGRFAENKFHYIMTYTITSAVNGNLVLKKTDVQLSELKKYN